jgi:hypothetical protein
MYHSVQGREGERKFNVKISLGERLRIDSGGGLLVQGR